MLNLGRLRSRFIRLGLLTLLVVTTGAVSAGPQVSALLVCPQGCPFTSIQWAIDSAPDGATIIVGPGTYEENLLIERSINIIGAGPEDTVIEGRRWDLPVVQILGLEEGRVIAVTIKGIKVVAAEVPVTHLLEVIVGCSPTLLEGCSAGVFIRGSGKISLSETEIVGPPDSFVPTMYGIAASGPLEATITAIKIRFVFDGIAMGSESAEAKLILAYSNIEATRPFPLDATGQLTEQSTGIDLGKNVRALLYHNHIHNHEIGVVITGARTSLIENEISGNLVGIGFGTWQSQEEGTLGLQSNIISHNRIGLVVEPGEVRRVEVCEGNRFEENEEYDIAVGAPIDSPSPRIQKDDEMAELARRCGVELGEGE